MKRVSDKTLMNRASARARGRTVHYSHIIGNLYVGGATPAGPPPEITAVLDVSLRSGLRSAPEGVLFMGAPLYDDPINLPSETFLNTLVDWAVARMEQGPTLIMCRAGLNRSCLVAALVLMRLGWTADEAISVLREKRSPECLTNLAFERYLRSR